MMVFSRKSLVSARTGRAIATVVAAFAVVLFAASSASAHAQLESTAPSAGATIARPPSRIELRFSEHVRVPNGGLRVFNEAGARLDRVSPRTAGSVVSLPLSSLPTGAYVVSWRVVSADGHPVRGAFTFRVGVDGGGGAEVGDQSKVALLARRLLAASTSRTDVAALYALLRFVSLVAMVVLVGAAIFDASAARGFQWNSRLRRCTIAAGIAAGVGGIGSLLVFGPFVTGRSLGAISDGTLFDDTLRDHTGRAILLRSAALVALSYVLSRRSRVGAAVGAVSMTPALAAILLAFVAVVGQVQTGHGAVGRYAAAAAVFSAVHVLGASAWVGGLFLLVREIGRSANGGDLSLAFGGLRRFSRLATAAVVALLVSGLFATWRQVGSLRALRTTAYGRVLTIKVAIVAAMLVVGAYNRRAVRRAGNAPERLSEVRRRIGAEAIGGVLVLVATALLVNTAPARDVVARPQSSTLRAQTTLVDLTVAPARRGRNDVHLYALTPEGLPKPVTEISASAELPSAGIAPIPLRLVRAGPNHFQVLALDLPIAGTWRITARVRVDAFTEEVASGTVTVAK